MLSTYDTRAEETERDWVRAHAALSRLARERAAADAEEGRWLLCALRSADHVHLGFGSFVEYVERLFGYKPRSTQLPDRFDRVRRLRHRPATSGRRAHPRRRDIVAMAHCDRQHLGPIAPLVANENALPVAVQTDAGVHARAAADHAHAGADATTTHAHAGAGATPVAAHAYADARADHAHAGADATTTHAHAGAGGRLRRCPCR